jgi:hypothetical protein
VLALFAVRDKVAFQASMQSGPPITCGPHSGASGELACYAAYHSQTALRTATRPPGHQGQPRPCTRATPQHRPRP